MIRVLLLEDDADHAELIVEAFRDDHRAFQVRWARTLTEARAAVAAEAYDLVVADVRVPDGAGTDLLAEVGDRVPMVLVTSHGDERVAVAAMKAGALDYVVKSPATFAALPAIARSALREWRQLVRLRETTELLRHADRLTTVGRVAASAIHEIGTPLNVVRMQAQLLLLDAPDEATAAAAREIVTAVDRASALVRGMLDLARRSEVARAPTDVVAVARRVVEVLAPTARRLGVRIALDAPERAIAIARATQLEQVMLNLGTNALDAMPDGGVLSVIITDHGDDVRLAFRDTGEGIAREDLNRVFQPFFTTKPAGRGTGLGLSVSADIVEEHGGHLWVTSDGAGSTFWVDLPRQAGTGGA